MNDTQKRKLDEILAADTVGVFGAFDEKTFLAENLPAFSSNDETLADTYLFRAYSYLKHVKKTQDGYVVTEFLPDVPWAGADNAVTCPVGHQIREGRWFRDRGFLRAYIRHYATGRGRQEINRVYSHDFVAAVCEFCLFDADRAFAEELFLPLEEILAECEAVHANPSGLFWSYDNYDGMEFSVSGNGLRPTVNSYVCAGHSGLSHLAAFLGKTEEAKRHAARAEALKKRINETLWDEKDGFYKTVPASHREDTPEVRGRILQTRTKEEVGFIPFMYGIADADKDGAFRYLFDPACFNAPYGITTADRSSPDYRTWRIAHECLWDGPVWPYATSQTLTALARTLQAGRLGDAEKAGFYDLLHTYAASHTLTENGKTALWIDENLDPDTGVWLARDILKKKCDKTAGRGVYYNHSTYIDLVLSGLLGVGCDGACVTVSPILSVQTPAFSVRDVKVGGHTLSVDFDGKKLTVTFDGEAFDCPSGKFSKEI